MPSYAPLIIFADDDPDTLQLYRMIVQRSSYEGLFISNTADVLYLCQTEPIALLVISAYQSHMNGVDLFTTLRSDPGTRYLPVLFVTASSMEERLLPPEINGVIRKPFTHYNLLEAIASVLNAAPV